MLALPTRQREENVDACTFKNTISYPKRLLTVCLFNRLIPLKFTVKQFRLPESLPVWPVKVWKKFKTHDGSPWVPLR